MWAVLGRPGIVGIRASAAAVALAALFGACDADRITSSEMGLSLEMSISDASVNPGEAETITSRLRNVGRVALTIDAYCTILPYIKDERDVTVYPGGGGWGCLTVAVPPVTLAPGEVITRTVVVNGGSTVPPGASTVTLPAGRYTAYAEFTGGVMLPRRHRPEGLTGERAQLRSGDVAFVVAG